MDTDLKWLGTLRAGSAVAVQEREGFTSTKVYTAAHVSRTTATQIIVPMHTGTGVREMRFSRSTGRVIGSRWDGPALVEITPTVKYSIRSRKAFRQFYNEVLADPSKLITEEFETMLEALWAYRKAKGRTT